MFDGSDLLQQDVCLTCLVSFPLRRPGWASEHQSAQLPAVLPLSLLAETHPGWSEGAGAAGPPPAGSGRHQGSALHPPDVLQGHLQPPDAGGQRQLLLAVQWVWQWPSGLLRQIPDDHFSLYLFGERFCIFLKWRRLNLVSSCPGCPSLSLRGRPRKRRGRDGKDSPTSSQSESWIEKMKVCSSFKPFIFESLY